VLGVAVPLGLSLPESVAVCVSVGVCVVLDDTLCDGDPDTNCDGLDVSVDVTLCDPLCVGDGVPLPLVVAEPLGDPDRLRLCVPVGDWDWLGEIVTLGVAVDVSLPVKDCEPVGVAEGECVALGVMLCDGDGVWEPERDWLKEGVPLEL